MQKGLEATSQFIVPRGEAAKLLESIEESIDQVSRLVAMPVDFPSREPIAPRRDDGLSASRFDSLDQRIAVVTLVGNHSAGRDGRHEGGTLCDIGDLTSGENKSNRIAQCIDCCMDLGGQPTPRSADRLIATVFLAHQQHVGGREQLSSQ